MNQEEFSNRLKDLSESALEEKQFALSSGYASKRERLCRAYLKSPNYLLEKIGEIYLTADEFFATSALEQRMTLSLMQALYTHLDIRYARAEVINMLKTIKESSLITVDAMRNAMQHSSYSSARTMIKVGLQWGLIDYVNNANHFAVGDSPILKEIERVSRQPTL